MSKSGQVIATFSEGNIKIYKMQTGWQQYGGTINETFGDLVSVAVDSSGETVIIGDATDNLTGSVSVYKINNDDEWELVGIKIPGSESFDLFGGSVSMSDNGKFIAVGAAGSDDNTGQVKVYKYTSNEWKLRGESINGDGISDFSGVSIDISSDGKMVAIGAPLNTGSKGQVRVFEYISNDWTQNGQAIYGEDFVDSSGSYVSISSDGTVLAIGAPRNGSSGISSGHVRTYAYADSEWEQIGDDIDGEQPFDYAGAVALSGNGKVLVIGASGNDDNGNNSGHVRVFKYNDPNWDQLGDTIGGEVVGENSGHSIGISDDGKYISIGAPKTHGGRVRVYEWAEC